MTLAEGSLKKPKFYETRQIRLRSPLLHIGSAVSQLSPFEYVQTANRVYLPDTNRLARELQRKGGRLLDDYIRAIETRNEITPVLRQAFGDDWTTATDSENQLLFPERFSSRKWVNGKITDLRPMIRNGFGQLYIPGSSIKGAMRTAIAYHLLKNEEKYHVPETHRVSAIEAELRKRLDKGELSDRWKQVNADDDLLTAPLFTDYKLRYQNRPVQAKPGPNTDLMRAVHISDAEPLIPKTAVNQKGQKLKINESIASEVVVSSRYSDGKAKYRASLYAEVVKTVDTTFTLTLDYELLSWFHHSQGMSLPFQTIDELVKLCADFAKEQWSAEQFYWEGIQSNANDQGKDLDVADIKQFYEKDPCPFNLRLGWASGLLGTTVGLCLPEDLVETLRDTCGKEAPSYEAPKSRRTVLDSKGIMKYAPGWVKFEAVKS